ncbi:hypothetical protein SLE2022_384390 [Rubroshorea leprosula]
MSVKERVVPEKSQVVKSNVPNKRMRLNNCFSFKEITMEPGTSLKDIDSNQFKDEIKRWAKAVVKYARQVSSSMRSSRKSSRFGSSRRKSSNGIGSPESSSHG